ncbi:regulator of G-protein signaling 5 [Microtus ochrogaster]|uniref:Regulator of G-protein signaling 5 n=1 Tax=Microtus ochrogaster TaxID=79684 RepID=A0ABM0LPV6_MICOH|nr:regulator of G-protein signaling 5 [Microtus ochrogaster]
MSRIVTLKLLQHCALSGVGTDRYTRKAQRVAKEIKIKLGILLQKPDSVDDLVMPYNEKPEKPAKTHKQQQLTFVRSDERRELVVNKGQLWGFCADVQYVATEYEGSVIVSSTSDLNAVQTTVQQWLFSTIQPTLRTKEPNVNFDHFTKDITMKNLVEPSRSSFNLAQKRIYAPMEKHSLPRCVHSRFYKELIK